MMMIMMMMRRRMIQKMMRTMMHCKFSLNPQLPLYADLLDFLDEPDPLVLSSIDPHAPHPMPINPRPQKRGHAMFTKKALPLASMVKTTIS